MDEETSREGNNQRGRPADKNKTASIQASADVSSEGPSRVHIFKGKRPPGVSSKFDGEQLEFSSIRPNTPAHSGHGDVQTGILVEIHPPVVTFKDKLAHVMGRIEKGKKALYEAAMKAEDLEAILQALRRTRNRISKRRK